MCWRYVDVFLSQTASLLTRVVHASYVCNFLRIWRGSVCHNPDQSLKTNFISRETYIDMLISCHFAVLLIKLTRDFTPGQPVSFKKSGSDVCEDHFSANGSFVVNKNTYNFLDMLHNTSKMTRLNEITTEKDGLTLNKRHKKQETVWEKGVSESEPANLCDYPTDQMMADSWTQGLEEAKTDLMSLLGEYWQTAHHFIRDGTIPRY